MVCEHRASLRAQTQSSMTTVGSNTVSVWRCSSYKPPSAAAAAAVSSPAEIKQWEELLSLVPGNFLSLNICLPCGPGRRLCLDYVCGRLLFTKDKLWSPYAWQGRWMWFPMTSTYQDSLTMTGISCCDFDTSQHHFHFDGACLPDGQRWQEDSDDGKVEEEALKRPGRGLTPLGKAIMTLLSLSMSIAL